MPDLAGMMADLWSGGAGWWWVAALAGVVAGAASSLVGIGGGILLVPVFHYGLGMAWGAATTASLASMVVQVPLGVWRHRRRGAVDMSMGWRLAAGGAAGVIAAWAVMPWLPVPALKALFAGILLLGAWRLAGRLPEPAPARTPSGAGVAALGAAAGALSRWLGVGGGILTGPALMMGGVAPHVAVGTSLVAVWTNAALAVALETALAPFPGVLGVLAVGAVAGVGALAGVPAGVRLAHALPPRGLRRTVAAALAAAALWLLVRLAFRLESA